MVSIRNYILCGLLLNMVYVASCLAQDSDTLFYCSYDADSVSQAVHPVFAKGHPEAISFSNSFLVDGKQGNALRIGSATQAGFVNYPAFKNIDIQQGTIEFWIQLQWDCTENTSRNRRIFFDVGTGSSKNRLFLHSWEYKLEFGFYDNVGIKHAVRSTSYESWEKGQWHHVMCTWSLEHKRMTIAVDNHLEDGLPENRDKGSWEADYRKFTTIRVGAFGNTQTPFNGSFDELRISRIAKDVSASADRSEINLKSRIASARKNYFELAEWLTNASKAGIKVPYFEVVAKTVETGLARLEKPQMNYTQQQLVSYCDYINRRCQAASMEIQDVLAGKKKALNVSSPDVLNLKIRGDQFVSSGGGEGPLLVGIRGAQQEEEIPSMSKFFNLTNWSWHSPAHRQLAK